MDYPDTKRLRLVERIHGVDVADPYRWLEEDDSPQTRGWVDAQNALTRATLDGAARNRFIGQLRASYDCPRTMSLVRRGGRDFSTHNPGLLDQPVLVVRDGPDAEPRILIDPNALSADGTTAITAFEPSPDGRLIAYALSSGGSDSQEIRIRPVRDAAAAGEPRGTGTDVGDRADLPDRLLWVKFASIAWARDSAGFYYLRFPAPGSVPPGDEQYYGRVCFHRVGDPQAADALVFGRPDRKDIVPRAAVSDSGRWIVITAQRGASDESEIHVIDAADPERGARPIFTGFAAEYRFVEESDGRLLFHTTEGAPMGRIVAVDAGHPERGITEVIAERPDRLSLARVGRDSLVVSYLHNASDRVQVFDRTGAPRGELPLPDFGSLVSLDAQPRDDEARAIYTSFTDPPHAAVFDLQTMRSRSGRRARPSACRTTQVWYPSKDGTPISMFLVHRADLPVDGRRRVLLSGYGGFNISRTPEYDPGNVPFLEDGIFALANLRGGGEYGDAWHRAGMLERKQNVFDDFIAAAEYLIAEGYTAPERLAIEGGSNGGLLVGAVMLQRPELFGAVVCRVPVADMLRYHLFTVGRFWIPEYGSADDPEQFAYLLGYSPYHNVREGVRYPATLVMTADTDDRVAPAMARKFAARLQASGTGGPFLIRTEKKAGHGSGKPIAKVIEEDADILAFLDRYLAR